MRIENIKEGMKVPNYRKLCQLLGEPIKDGTSKSAQLKHWEQYFSYDRQGNAYIITEVYDNPKISTDKRRVFSALAEPLLLHYLSSFCAHGQDGGIEHSIKDWCIFLGLAPAKIFDENTKSEYIGPNGFSPLSVNRITYEIIEKTRTILLSTVNKLEKEGILKSKLNTYIIKQMQHIPATEDECAELDRIKKEVLQEIGASNMFAVRLSRAKSQKYTEALSRIMKERHNWDSHYNLLSIIPCNYNLILRYQTIDTGNLQAELKREIQSSIQAALAAEQKLSDQKQDEFWEKADLCLSKAPFYFSRIMENEMVFLMEQLL